VQRQDGGLAVYNVVDVVMVIVVGIPQVGAYLACARQAVRYIFTNIQQESGRTTFHRRIPTTILSYNNNISPQHGDGAKTHVMHIHNGGGSTDGRTVGRAHARYAPTACGIPKPKKTLQGNASRIPL